MFCVVFFDMDQKQAGTNNPISENQQKLGLQKALPADLGLWALVTQGVKIISITSDAALLPRARSALWRPTTLRGAIGLTSPSGAYKESFLITLKASRRACSQLHSFFLTRHERLISRD